MNSPSFDLAPARQRARPRSRRHRSASAVRHKTDDGFLCKHCHAYVSSALFLSGVQNRNHCPYCLWSCHLDWREAGDRLSACKAPMRPVGLTAKATHKKYGTGRGELMLIHLCTDCGSLSINRIAADDDCQTVLAVFEWSFQLETALQARLKAENIQALSAEDAPLVHFQLFGGQTDMAEMLFQRKVMESV